MGMEFVLDDILAKCRTLYGVDRLPPVAAILLNIFVATVLPCRDSPNKRILAAIVKEKSTFYLLCATFIQLESQSLTVG